MRTTLLLAGTLVITQFGCSPSASDSQGRSASDKPIRSADTLHSQAIEFATQGDFDHASTLLDEALRIAPDRADLYVSRGTIARKRGDYSHAIEDLGKAIELSPTFPDAYCQRAFAYQQSGLDKQGKNAFTDATRAIELDHTSSLSFIIRGNAFLTQGQFKLAIADFDIAIELNPRSWSAYGNRARAYADSGDVAMAIRDLDRAFSFNPPPADLASLKLIEEDLRQRSERP
jgi:tetratricopeptide (TPR) repeat protein